MGKYSADQQKWFPEKPQQDRALMGINEKSKSSAVNSWNYTKGIAAVFFFYIRSYYKL